MLITIIITITITSIILLIFYIRQIALLIPRLSILVDQKLLPERWLLIAFVPFFGVYISERLKFSLDDFFVVNLAIKRENNFKPVKYVPTSWVLLQEYYDRKTSMHHGTDMKFLQTKSYYQFVPFGEAESSTDIIYVEVARIVKQKNAWASLDFQAPYWRLVNLKSDTVIPIINNNEKIRTVNTCHPSEAFILSGGESFIIGLSEYRIFKLPNILLKWREGEKKYFKMLEDKTVEWPIVENMHEIALPKKWKIEGVILTAYTNIVYTKIVLPNPVSLKAGEKITIMPGDKFNIENFDVEFWFEYEGI